MQFEVLTEAELATVVGGVSKSVGLSVDVKHTLNKLAGTGGCGCGVNHS